MTEFWIEDDKDAIKTRPTYPGCCCKQQASPHSPAARGFVSQAVEGIQGPLEELGLTTFMERREQGSKRRKPGNEELLDFPPPLVLQSQVSMPLESCS